MTRWISRVSAGAAMALACIVLFSACVKLSDLASFQVPVRAHGLVPANLVAPATWVFVPMELLVGAAACWACVRGHPAHALLILSAGFAALGLYSSALVVAPPPVPAPCGCLAGAGKPVESWAGIAGRNLGVAAGLGLLALVRARGASARS